MKSEAKLSKESISDEKTFAEYYGYYDGDGKYIDCSKIANITVYVGDKVVKFDNFNSSKNVNGINVKVGLPTLVETLGQDDNYIYSLIQVPILGAKREYGGSDVDGPLYYIQKISKSSQEKEDGADIPSNVESYQLSVSMLAADRSNGWTGDNWGYATSYGYIIDNYLKNPDKVKIKCHNGKIFIAFKEDDGKIKSIRLILKRNAKVTLDSGEEVIEKMVFEDTSNESDDEPYDWTMDSNGNIWIIYKGKIQKSTQGEEFQNIYKTDRTMDRLDVYDDFNLIAWSTTTDIYTTVHEGELAENLIKKTGWNKNEDGKWSLYNLSGEATKGWYKVNNSTWYYFDNNGFMNTGWLEDDGKTYYMSNSGMMKKGWVKISDKWYYFDQSGVKQKNTIIDGYVLNENGEWIG